MKHWSQSAVIVFVVALLGGGCDKPTSAQPAAATSAPPLADPATLPKLQASVAAIDQMLKERFGADVVRNLRTTVDDRTGGVRVQITGEVPSEEIRQAIIREVEVRVEGLRVSDINLDIAGPTRMLATFDAPVHNANRAVFSADLSLAVTQFGEVYETATGRRINRLANVDLPDVQSIAFSPDGKWLATGHAKSAVTLWDMPAGTTRKLLVPADTAPKFARIFAIDFTGDSKSVVTINEERGELMMWDIATGQGKLIGTHIPNATSGSSTVYTLAVSPDGKWIATASDHEREGVILWDVAGRRKADTLQGELFYPRCLTWSQCGRYLAAGRFGQPTAGTVIAWDMTTKQPRFFSPEQTAEVDALAFSPDAKALAIRYRDDGVAIWEFETGKKWIDIHRDKVGSGSGLRFGPDGNVLATECSSLQPAGVRLWDVSKRPGGSGAAHLPPTLPQAPTLDDALAMSIEQAITSRDNRVMEWVKAEVLPDGSVRLTGKVASQYTKDNIGRTAETHGVRGEIVSRGQRKIVNDIEVTGRYGS